jgi:hypothetical protein
MSNPPSNKLYYLAVKMVAADSRFSWFRHDTDYCLGCKEPSGCVLCYKGNNTTAIDTSKVTQTDPQQLHQHIGFISCTFCPIWDQLPFARISSSSSLHFHLILCTYFYFNCLLPLLLPFIFSVHSPVLFFPCNPLVSPFPPTYSFCYFVLLSLLHSTFTSGIHLSSYYDP